MKVGFSLFMLGPGIYSTVARKADELGYESVWLPEHLVFPAAIPATYPYSADGRAPIRPRSPLFDPFVTLSYLAASTQRIRLGTSVYILPLRNPFVTARAVTTLDVLSQGRVTLGVGLGWLREEFEAVGESFVNRGERTAEIVEILKRLWTEETVEFHGKHYSFGPVKFEPKPVQQPHPPVHFGGETPAALRRAALLGDGWIGTRHSPEEVQHFVRQLTALRQDAGREGLPFEVTVNSALPPTVDNLRRYEEAGADRLMLVPWAQEPRRLGLQEVLDGLERFAQDVLAKLEG